MSRGKTKTIEYAELSDRELDVIRLLVEGKKQKQIANELDLSQNTVRAHLYNVKCKLNLRSTREIAKFAVDNDLINTDSNITLPKERPIPTNHEFYDLLKGGPVSLKDLSRKLDRSEETVLDLIDKMEQAGYVIERLEQNASFSTGTRPTHKPQIKESLLEEVDHQIKFGVASDIHSGSTCSQPTNLNRFIGLAVNEGVRHILIPGDVSAGVYGYQGHEYDLIPCARPKSRKEAYMATRAQVWLADSYIPMYDGLRYYMLGGNHDYWHISKVGIDAVSLIAQKRDDIYYLGYDVADVPLTERISARLIHPSGGVPYALCLSEDTEILTKRGWVGPETINMSDDVATLNPDTGFLEYQKPEELFVQYYTGNMLHFKSRTVDHLVTPEHRLWVRSYNEARGDGVWHKRAASEMLQARRQQWQMSMIADWEGEEVETFKVPFHSWSGARDLGDMPMDTFLEFLGWYISEGHIDGGKRIAVTQAEGPNIQRIKKALSGIGLNVKTYTEERESYKTIFRIFGYNASLVRWLQAEVGTNAHNKRVPRFVFDLSQRQIGIFLDSLFEGDGTKREGKRWGVYNTVSAGLAGDVQELLLKVGYAGTVSKAGVKYLVGVLEQNQPTINQRPNAVDYEGLIWCVKVPNGVIYARRNGRPIWTGNSYRLQKNIEQTAFEQLVKLVEEELPPTIRFILAGHLHVEVKFQSGPIIASQVGCFEGQTNYLKRKGLFPSIGGQIWTITLTDTGRIRRVEYEFIPYSEIYDDWKSWPQPPETDVIATPDELDILFNLVEE